MLFNSSEFLFLFLPVTLLVFFGVARWNARAALLSLALASLFFYSWWDWRFLPVLLVSTACNFLFGRGITRAESAGKILLTIAVAFNLCALFFYKYIDFVIANCNQLVGTDFPLLHVELPLGISFFTFTQIAYLVDVYREKAKESRAIDYTLFVSYFPHLIAGPILHHAQMMPQFRNKAIFTPRAEAFVIGFAFLTIGLIKKVLIADYIAKYATPVFSVAGEGAPLGFYEAWVGVLAYTLQLYFDFSGYCDMAIGISRMFNIDLPINFASPYQSRSIVEFWRRWHMTLSGFLRDYLYIPLGGNRFGSVRRYFNLFLTMLLGGLWHGANWTFVVWGALHGAFLIVNHGFNHLRERWLLPAVPAPLGVLLTLTAVMFAWVPFRADSMATTWSIWSAMLTLPAASMETVNASGVPVEKAARILLVWLLVALVCPNSQTLVGRLQERFTSASGGTVRWAVLGVTMGALFAITVMSLGNVSEFLYFQF